MPEPNASAEHVHRPPAARRRPPTGARSLRWASRVLLAGTLAGAMVLATQVGASATPDPVFPSKHQVDAAKAAAAAKAQDVAGIEAQLAAANQRLRAAETAAGSAEEDYNQSVYDEQQAQATARTATRRAAAARRQADAERNAIGRFAAAAYQQQTNLLPVSVFVDADAPAQLMAASSTVAMVSQSFNAAYQQLKAAQVVAKVMDAQAHAALQAQRQATARARAAKAAAERAEQQMQATVNSVATQRQGLIADLARLQGISVRLAAQRQAGLEALARKKAEEARQRALAEARRKAELRRQAEQRRQAELARQREAAAQRAERQREEQAREARNRQQQQQQQSDSSSGSAGSTGSTGSSGSSGSSGGSSAGSSGGGGGSSSGGTVSAAQGMAAVRFALAQVGDPYVFGAAGPSTWDCSGLTMVAWQQAGVSMFHGAIMQYLDSTPIPLSAIRPGDLLFYATQPGNPYSIHHVVMYIGNGQIVQAPHTGTVVQVNPLFYLGTPDFVARP